MALLDEVLPSAVMNVKRTSTGIKISDYPS